MRIILLSEAEQKKLAAEIEIFRHRHGMAISTFGKLAVNSAGILPKMKIGKRITTWTRDKLVAFMADMDEIVRRKDMQALKLIAACQMVAVEAGEPCLETNTQIDAATLHRLISAGLLVPSGDDFFDVAKSQTFKPAQRELGI